MDFLFCFVVFFGGGFVFVFVFFLGGGGGGAISSLRCELSPTRTLKWPG